MLIVFIAFKISTYIFSAISAIFMRFSRVFFPFLSFSGFNNHIYILYIV